MMPATLHRQCPDITFGLQRTLQSAPWSTLGGGSIPDSTLMDLHIDRQEQKRQQALAVGDESYQLSTHPLCETR